MQLDAPCVDGVVFSYCQQPWNPGGGGEQQPVVECAAVGVVDVERAAESDAEQAAAEADRGADGDRDTGEDGSSRPQDGQACLAGADDDPAGVRVDEAGRVGRG